MYFKEYNDGLDSTELEASAPLPPDLGLDQLPFDLLDDRRFEILAYRLMCAEVGSGGRPSLMQGVGDRGRDVVVYSKDGSAVDAVVQCKRLRERMTAPAVRRELAKLALHAFLEPAILGVGPVAYELWCPGGFTEPASTIFDRWPTLWTEDLVQENAEEVIGEYAKFNSLSWDKVKTFVIAEFPALVRPTRLDNVALTAKLRRCIPVYKAFFGGAVVMEAKDVDGAIRKIFADVGGYRELADKDAKHVLDRICSFDADKRLVLMTGFVMGLSPQLIARFDEAEFEAFAKDSLNATTGILKTVGRAAARISAEFSKEFRESVSPRNSCITHILLLALTAGLAHRMFQLMPMGLQMQPKLAAYGALAFREKLVHHIKEEWHSFERCIAGYNPKIHAYGSDEEFRCRLARKGLDGATTFSQFEANVLEAIDEHLGDLERRFDQFMTLLPEQLLVVNDTMTAFDNKWLMQRMVESVGVLDAMKAGGSSLA